MDEFLKTEYQTCIDLLKYYDQRQVSSLQFSAGLSSAVATALLALVHDAQLITESFLQLIAVASAVTALGLAALLSIMVQTRLYFVFPARQANAIRKTEIAKLGDSFPENCMYIDTGFAAFKLFSAQSMMFALVSLQIGIFSAISFFTVRGTVVIAGGGLVQSIVLGAVVGIVGFIIAGRYLVVCGARVADLAVHAAGKDKALHFACTSTTSDMDKRFTHSLPMGRRS